LLSGRAYERGYDFEPVQKEHVQDIYYLSPMQEGMLYHAMLDPESSSYFTQLELFIDGEFDLGIFEKSVNQLVH
jgi:surfactin family lipopeptide synthetase B/lichenysin synthetase B